MALKYTYQDVSDFKKVVDKLQRRASTVELTIAEELYAIHRGGPIYLRKRGTTPASWMLLFCTLQAEIMKVAKKYADPTVDYAATKYTTFPIKLVPSRLLHHVPDLAEAPDYDTVFGASGRANVRRFLKACNDALNLCHMVEKPVGTLAGMNFKGYMEQTEQVGDEFKRKPRVNFDQDKEQVHFVNAETAEILVDNEAAYPCTIRALFRYDSNFASPPVSRIKRWEPQVLETRQVAVTTEYFVTKNDGQTEVLIRLLPFSGDRTYWYTRTLLPQDTTEVYNIKDSIWDVDSWPGSWYVGEVYRVRYSGKLPAGMQPVSGWDGVFEADDLIIRSSDGWYRVPADRARFLRRRPERSNDASRCFTENGPPEYAWDMKTDSLLQRDVPDYEYPSLDAYDTAAYLTWQEDGERKSYAVRLDGNLVAYSRKNRCFVDLLVSDNPSLGEYGAHTSKKVDFKTFFDTSDPVPEAIGLTHDAVSVATLSSYDGSIVGYSEIKPVRGVSTAVDDYSCDVCLMYDYNFDDQ